MSNRLQIALAAVFIFFSIEEVSAQIDGESIATAIALDSGNPREQYLEYGYNLAKTLKLLTPPQLARVFGEGTTVNLPDTLNELLEMGDVTFEGGSAVLSPSATQELDKVAEFLAINNTAKITIEGHAWYQNDRAQGISEERAVAAMTYLVQMGISEDRIETIGYGGTRPLVTDPDRDKTTANRRIEIRVNE